VILSFIVESFYQERERKKQSDEFSSLYIGKNASGGFVGASSSMPLLPLRVCEKRWTTKSVSVSSSRHYYLFNFFFFREEFF
jgi:hypothetical protein